MFAFSEGTLAFSGATFDRVVLASTVGNFGIDNRTVRQAAVPEPGTITFVAAAIVGLAARRRSRVGISTAAKDDMVLDSKWHWKGFENAMQDPQLRSRLDHFILTFDEDRRAARIVISGVQETDVAMPYVGG